MYPQYMPVTVKIHAYVASFQIILLNRSRSFNYDLSVSYDLSIFSII